MSRASAIGAVIVASAVLVGGSIVSVYAINSSVIADDAPHAVIQAAVDSAPASPSAQDVVAHNSLSDEVTGPTIGPEDLTVSSSDDELIVPVVPDPQPAKTGANRAAGESGSSATTPVAQRSIGAAGAQRVVARSVGGRLLATWSTQRNGLAVYAVKVQRGDGSVIVGYVDRTNGTVVDWARISAAPAKPGRTSTSTPTRTAAPSVRPTPRPTRHSGSPRPESSQSAEPTDTEQESAESPSPTPRPTSTRQWRPQRQPRPTSPSFNEFSSQAPSSWESQAPTEVHSSEPSDD